MSERADQPDPGRREFVGKAAAAAALLALAPGVKLVDLVFARSEEEPVTDAVRWGMLIDTSKCAEGCDACVRACDEEFGLESTGRPEIDTHYIRKLDLRDEQTGKTYFLPMLCQHCEHPPCVDVCPTGASFRRADGIVLVDKHICIGCRYCMMACPYKARSFDHAELSGQRPYAPRGKGTVESCTFCAHRVDRGETPACVEACAATGNRAMIFGDLKDPSSEVAKRARVVPSTQVRADLGLNTGVRYEGI
jgi:molybdopterin-containing oxidoreductase family iron-sulfur binding subunit